METRKVQKSGNSSFVVSLPAAWARAHGIGKNSPVSVEVNPDGSISIIPDAKAERQCAPFVLRLGASITASDLRKLIGAYVSGHSTIVLVPHQRDFSKAVRLASDFTSRVMGQEVVEESEKQIVIKDVLQPSEFPTEKILRRMGAISRSMLSAAILQLQNPQESNEVVETMEKNVDRLLFLVARKHHRFLRFPHMAAEEGVSLPKSHLQFLTALSTERVADYARFICKASAGVPRQERAVLCKVAEASGSIYGRTVEALSKFDSDGAQAIIEDVRSAQDRLWSQLPASKSSNSIRIFSSLRRISEYSTNMCENLIDFSAHPET